MNPTLLVEHPDGVRPHAIDRDITLGRDRACDVVIDHPTVSRQHGRIEHDAADGTWRFVDTHARNARSGTQTLRDATPIRLGRVRAIFFAGAVPDDVDFGTGDSSGRLVRCLCGRVAFVPNAASSVRQTCTKCDRPLQLDAPAPSASPPCAACHTAIAPTEPRHDCPGCAAAMHADCWRESGGCVTYGCRHMHELTQPIFDTPAASIDTADVEVLSTSFHLARALLATLLGLLAFGAPALVVMLLDLRAPATRRFAVLSAVGVVAGVAVSWYWWVGSRV